ncbi:TPA: colicin E3/pyocin S6 family cytotoxin, partial [Klebsiella pneumoniae]
MAESKDSQHGELEGYRASDGEHLGAFDPKTGNDSNLLIVFYVQIMPDDFV